jgi:uncharacterized protein YjbI with pentapeptide repeats
MADEEHLARLNQGVEAWNEWRENNPEIIPDLSRAYLREVDLREADFRGAKLIGANLAGAELNRAELSGAMLSLAYLIGVNFSAANLSSADLSSADLSRADLSSANLNGANFREANLRVATLVEADLRGAFLVEADLREAELRGAILWGAILDEANLSRANFREAHLNYADLVATQALATSFEKAILTGVCIKDWHTNSATNFNDVLCDYVYLEIDQQERRPHRDNFTPGEFTKLFQKARETVDLIFRNGVDWQAFLVSFEQLQVEAGDKALFIQAIENKNDGAFVIRVSVPSDLDKSQIEQYFKRKYQFAIKAKDKQYRKYLRERLKDKDDLIVSYREQMISIRQDNTKLIGIIKIMAEKENSKTENTFNISGSLGSVANQGNIASSGNQNNIGNAAGEAKAELKSIQHIHNYAPEQKQTLAEAATEIQHLLKQLEQTNPTATEAQQIEHINDETTPKFKKRVVGALQATSEAAIDEFVLENKYLKVAKAAIKGWMKPE